jgi:solute carrier family 25 (mitochondrial carnitine/acylcarnitine transporter), member 20/29
MSSTGRRAEPRSYFAREFAAGCFAGCAASVVGQPLDTIRIRVQTAPAALFAGPLDAATKTVRKEGVRGLFRGALPPLIGMGPKNAIGFAVQGAALRLLERSRGDHQGGAAKGGRRSAGMGNVMLAGAVAGLVQCAVIVPSDRVKIQLQVSGRAMQRSGGAAAPVVAADNSASLGAVRRCVVSLVQREGVRIGLFRGWWPTVIRQVPSSAIFFSVFEALKRVLGDGALATAAAGGCAGCAGYLCTYPLDVLKSAAMAAPPGTQPADVSMQAVAQRLRAEHGGSARWALRGLVPTLARGFVINATSFAIFEWAISSDEE